MILFLFQSRTGFSSMSMMLQGLLQSQTPFSIQFELLYVNQCYEIQFNYSHQFISHFLLCLSLVFLICGLLFVFLFYRLFLLLFIFYFQFSLLLFFLFFLFLSSFFSFYLPSFLFFFQILLMQVNIYLNIQITSILLRNYRSLLRILPICSHKRQLFYQYCLNSLTSACGQSHLRLASHSQQLEFLHSETLSLDAVILNLLLKSTFIDILPIVELCIHSQWAKLFLLLLISPVLNQSKDSGLTIRQQGTTSYNTQKIGFDSQHYLNICQNIQQQNNRLKMATLVAQGACCCLACCCQQCIDGLKKWLGPQKVTKIFYFFLVIVFTVPAIFIFFFLNQWKDFISYFKNWIYCPNSVESADKLSCIGQSVVFRLSLALLILFALMMIVMLFRARISMILNEGCFCSKYIIVVGAFIGFLWVDVTVFDNYAQFAKYASIVYMVLQSIIIIDLFYLGGIKLVKKYDEGQTQYACYLIFLSIIVQAIAIGLNVLGYIKFPSETQQCTSTLWVNIITSIMLIILPIIQLFHFNPQGSLLTTTLVSTFISYLSFISQFSYGGNIQGQTCVRMDVSSLVADIVCSTFFFVLTMYGSIMGGTGQVKVTRNGNLNDAIGVGTGQSSDKQQVKQGAYKAAINNTSQAELDQSNEKKYTQTFQWAKWHFYMCIAAIYLSMLITNWISINVTTGEIKSSNFGFWVRVTVSWGTFLLYIWTLIAPRVCPGRDFHVE